MKFALQDNLLQLGDNYNEVFQIAAVVKTEILMMWGKIE
jgi:hypothetical protein